jgi:lipopolysaccharide/colanic/teichoic acid biosynthesis glycosyltransferase
MGIVSMTLTLEQCIEAASFDGSPDFSAQYIVENPPSKPMLKSVASQSFTLDPTTRLEMRVRTISNFNRALKRVLDITIALTGLVLTFPFLVILSIALQIDSPGRLFFAQQRVGRDGKLFQCLKFRTMREDSLEVLKNLLASCPESRREWEQDHKLRNDPRVSRFGKIVRALSLDELPQMINILKGDMSVVGPRPIVISEIPKYGRFYRFYKSAKPGLTGLWQVSGRNDVSYSQRVQLDREYTQRASLSFDLMIMARTIPAVLGAKGSY